MDGYMSIDAFSKRTGVAKSALRYYESKNLLHPKRDEINDYRYYSQNDMETVRLISSLRLAGIPIKDIQQYLLETESVRRIMMEKWLFTLKQKNQILNTSIRYLESSYFGEQIYLIEKEAENIIWFAEESTVGKFGAAFFKRKEELNKHNISIKNGYLKYISGGETIKALVGFGVSENTECKNTGSVEYLPSCICIAMPFTSEFSQIKKGYQKLMNYAVEHDFVPTGPIMEWYRDHHLKDVDLILPVVQFKEEGM